MKPVNVFHLRKWMDFLLSLEMSSFDCESSIQNNDITILYSRVKLKNTDHQDIL